MPTLSVDPRLYERARQLAAWRHIPPEALTAEALEAYLDQLEWEKLQAEEVAFQQMLPQLLQQYPGEYVAIHEGQIIDHDPDRDALFRRVYAKMGAIPVLFRLVTTEPPAEIAVRSPRIERDRELP